MRIGIPTEIKPDESRVALTPGDAHELVAAGHAVSIQAGAGVGSGFSDAEYAAAGVALVGGATEAEAADRLWATAELIVKVKEPIAAEYPRLRPDLTVFAYLHLAADRPLTEAILGAGTTAIAFETVQRADRSLPLLAPMSEVAGRLSVQVGAYHLMRAHGGRGVLLGGVPGTPAAHVVVIGAGVAGENAARMAMGLGARVTVLDVDLPRLRELDKRYQGRLAVLRSSPLEIAAQLADADLVIGSVLIPGAQAPKLVTDAMVAGMLPGSVLVDIAIDQGGCFEGSRPTTHSDPTFAVHGSLFYCVANMPGAVPRTATQALSGAVVPYARQLAGLGVDAALAANPELAAGLSMRAGVLHSAGVATAHGLEAVPFAG